MHMHVHMHMEVRMHMHMEVRMHMEVLVHIHMHLFLLGSLAPQPCDVRAQLLLASRGLLTLSRTCTYAHM